jgi:hypothetical protein
VIVIVIVIVIVRVNPKPDDCDAYMESSKEELGKVKTWKKTSHRHLQQQLLLQWITLL